MYQRLIELTLTLALAALSAAGVHIWHLQCDSGCNCQTCQCVDCQCCGACSDKDCQAKGCKKK